MKLKLIPLILTVLLLTGCAMYPSGQTAYKQISMTEAVKMMESESGYIILDVRRSDEFAEGHIPGAINIPNESIGGDEISELPDKDQLIMVYCRSGRRSKEASQKLAELGYTNIVEFGGILDWTGEIEKGNGMDTSTPDGGEGSAPSAPDSGDGEASDGEETDDTSNTKDPDTGDTVIQTADFTIYDSDINAVKLSDFFGKPIVVNFWATWCPPCKAELPAFNALYENYKDDVVFIMINVDGTTADDINNVLDFISDNGYTLPVYYDLSYSATIAYEVSGIPETFFINSSGELVTSHLGGMNEATLESYIMQII